jgi:hypothetical protein
VAERRHKRNSTFKKSATVEAVNGGQVTTSSREDNLQKAAYKSNQVQHSLTTSAETTKLMALKGREPVGSKIVRHKNCRTGKFLLTT